MKTFIFALAALMLAACASAPAATDVGPGPAPTPSVTPSSGSSRLAQMLQSAGRNDAPTRAVIERAFGEADIVRQDGAGAAWTYRLETCALLLLFAPDERNELRLSDTHVSARRGGDAPTLEQCAAEAARRS